MIITTIQEANLQDCGCCAYPVCANPQKECESISVGECSETMPEHEDVPPEDACMMMSGKTVEWQVDNSNVPTSIDFGGIYYTGIGAYGESSTTVLRRIKISGFCSDDVVSFADDTYANSTLTNEGGTSTFVESSTGSSSWTPPADPTGSVTTIYTVNGIEVYNVTSDYTGITRDLTPDSSWDYVGLYRFEKTTTETGWDGSTIDRVYAVTYIPANIEDLKTQLDDLNFPDDANGSLCYSGVEYDPECEGSILSLFKSRYRFAPPDAWFTEWDAWHDGGEIGPEPAVRSVWEMEWDEVFFPKEWDEWDQGGRIGAEPTPTPSLVAERSWVWDGIKTDPERWSEWYSIDPPANPGQTRIVNMMITCWKSIRTGSKPTAFGEVYEFPPP